MVTRAEIHRLARLIEAFQTRFDPLFGRSEIRRWGREYVNGLLMNMERKNRSEERRVGKECRL